MSSVPVPAWYWEKLLSPRLKVNFGKSAFFDFTIVFSKLLPGEGGWSKSLVSSAGKSLLITKFLKKIPNLPRAILTFHGHFFLICHGQFSSFTDNFWPNLPRAILRVSRATFEILICHGQFSSFTGTFLRFAAGNKKFYSQRKTTFIPGALFFL